MKRKIVIIVTTTLLLLSMFLAACSVSFSLGSCTGKKQSGTITLDSTPTPHSVFNLSIQEDTETFYCLLFDGEVNFAYYPEKVTVSAAGEEYEVKPTSVTAGDGYYTFKFNNKLLFKSLDKGEYDVRVYGVKAGEKKVKPEKATLLVDDFYFITTIWDMETDEIKTVMDKESNWTPYY